MTSKFSSVTPITLISYIRVNIAIFMASKATTTSKWSQRSYLTSDLISLNPKTINTVVLKKVKRSKAERVCAQNQESSLSDEAPSAVPINVSWPCSALIESYLLLFYISF